ncbi:hypothetical protein EI983_18815 [Roseovarius faecimaris]|uniref:Uncharacterized protein n=1 Tax=Roseovarius faecimaris TaxID=2494550 RepID=A0A6I6IVV2_9RHOB|nr:hypothetical protein [Roseovarius faecimaris]QGY00205.1 hypothetical protein EI983_18815 [Roseovarius faecimaris]
MALSPRNKVVVFAVCAPLLTAGCAAEYINRWDTVSSRAGNANQANTAIQEITAWPKNVEDTDIEYGG